MITASDRFRATSNRIGWSSGAERVPLSCSACRSVRDVSPADNLAMTGFCEVCRDGARSHRELGGEA
jgi:hypothetical protein